MNKQKIEIIGRVVVKPKLQKSKEDKSYSRVRIAVNTSQKDKNGDKKDIVNYYDVLTFGKRAENMAKLIKGKLIRATGDIEISTYLSKDGNPKSSITVFSDEFHVFSTDIFK